MKDNKTELIRIMKRLAKLREKLEEKHREHCTYALDSLLILKQKLK